MIVLNNSDIVLTNDVIALNSSIVVVANVFVFCPSASLRLVSAETARYATIRRIVLSF